MLLPLSFPGFDGQNTKSRVISVLSQKYPMTKMKLYRELKRGGLSVGYHAVNKAVNELTVSSVVSRSEKEYKLDYDWVSQLHKFAEGLQSKLVDETGCLIHGVKDLKQEGNITTLTFDNLLDMDKYSKSVHDFYYSRLSPDADVCLVFEHHWWHILYPEEEFSNSVLNQRFYCVCKNDTLLDRAGNDFKRSAGMNVVYEKDIGSGTIAVYGDVVIQTFVSKELAFALDAFFVKTKSVKDMAVPQNFVKNILKKKGKIIVLINKNADLAAQMRQQVLGYF